MRTATHTALVALALLGALAPDLHAQRGGGRRGGGGRGGASGALFGAQRGARGGAGATFGAQRGRGKGAANAAPLGAKPQPAPPTTAPKAAALQADEQRFRRFLSDIDKKIAAADEGHAATDEQLDALGFDLPAGVEPGSVEWRNLQRPIFQTCDYDGGGWLSFRELQAAIAIDRDEFFAYDRDRDGRVGPREFTARYDDVVAKSGAFRLPKPKDAGGRIEPRSADQLRGAFDSDGDGGLDADELAAMLVDYGREELAPDVILGKVDLDGSTRVDGAELFQLSRLVSVAFVLPTPEESARARAGSVEQLFGGVVERPTHTSSVTEPPWMPGPVPHFRRLDLDGDGYIGADEMKELQGSASLGVRVGAVLATLDLDEDGRISAREFLTALTTARK